MSQNDDISGYEDILDNSGYEDILAQPDKPNFGNILQKAAKSIKESYVPQGGFSNPMIPAMSQSNPAMGAYNVLHNFKSKTLEDAMPGNQIGSMAADIATDPDVIAGMGGVAKGVGKMGANVAEGVKGVMNPLKAASRLSTGIEEAGGKLKANYSKGLKDTTSKYADKYTGLTKGKTVSFAEELGNPSTLTEQKLFNAVKEEAAFQGIDIENLTVDESKRVLDMIKGKSKIFEREIGPLNHQTAAKLESMKGRQLEAFSEMGAVDSAYGPGIEAYNELSEKAPQILEGGGNRLTKAAQMNKLKTLDPELHRQAKNYRNVNSIAKMVRNPLIQAASAIPLVGGAVKLISGKRQ